MKLQWRVYRLQPPWDEPSVICEVYEKNNRQEFQLMDQTIPNRRGQPLDRIPFVFHGAEDTDASVDTPPMCDISFLNIHHYLTSADLENGRHFTGLPQPYAVCFDVRNEDKLRIGSSTLWVTENEKGRVGYLEFNGDGLKTLEMSLTETEEQLAALGARMLEKQKGDEAYQTVMLRQSGQAAALIQLSEACSDSLSSVMKWAEWWGSTTAKPEDLDDETCGVVLNTDFVAVQLNRGETLEMAQVTQLGLFSKQTFHEWAQRAELIPADRDFEEEQALIAANPPAGLPPFGQPGALPGQAPGGKPAVAGGAGAGSGTAQGGTAAGGAKQGAGVPKGSNASQGGSLQSYQNR